MFNKIFNIERVAFFILIAGFFVGVWHAFPMLNVIGDEMYYVGGVLRAMEGHRIMPFVDDVPYGTLSYLVSYFVTSVFIIASLPFFAFKIASLKVFLITFPQIMYLLLRLTSVALAVFLLFLLNNLFKKELLDQKTRLFLLVLLFTNIITTVILHTGKMWVLSTLLVLISFYYLYKVICFDEDGVSVKKWTFLSILFSFLAFSNFPLNIYALINIPILIFYFRKDKIILYRIIGYSFIGFCAYLSVTLFNFGGIKNQIISIFTVYHPLSGDVASKVGFFSSFKVYAIKLIYLFPLSLVILLLSVRDGVRNKKLLYLSSFYFIVYFLAIVVVADWTSDLRSYLRYLFPLGFFIVLIISSFKVRLRLPHYIITGVSLFFYCLTLYYLSVPTTYNQSYNWVIKNLYYKDVVVINEVSDLQLLKNKKSSLLTQDKFCSSKCKNIIDRNLNHDFMPLVIDPISKDFSVSGVNLPIYYIKDHLATSSSLELVQSFENQSRVYHSVDYNLGNYFDLSYLRLGNLGKNQYIYKTKGIVIK